MSHLIERHRFLGGSANPLSISRHRVTTARGLLRLAKPNRPGEGVRLFATRETATALGYILGGVDAFLPDSDDAPTLYLTEKIDEPRRGRPAGATDPDTRRHREIVRTSDEESEQIAARAADAGKTVSEHMRDAAMGTTRTQIVVTACPRHPGAGIYVSPRYRTDSRTGVQRGRLQGRCRECDRWLPTTRQQVPAE